MPRATIASTESSALPSPTEVSVEELRAVVACAAASNTPVYILGAPGVGKTSIVTEELERCGLPVRVLIASQCDPTDLGGLPALDRERERVVRYPLGVVREACEGRVGLFLDEISLAPPAVQAALMRGVLEGIWGDARVHPESRVILAGNPPHQALGASELSLPLINRLTIVTLKPERREVQTWFRQLGAADSIVHGLALEFADVLDSAPNLLQLEPPADAAADQRPWGSPRAWERGLRMAAAALESGQDPDSRVVRAVLSGCVGDETAASFLSLRRLLRRLPTLEELLTTPERAPLPAGADVGVAVLGILRQAMKRDAAAGWVYAARLDSELGAAAYQIVLRHPLDRARGSPHYARALVARMTLAAVMGAIVAGRT
jgi:hypothetical protein